MDRKILKKMNKDIDFYYIYQIDELKDKLHIQKKNKTFFIPKLILAISICVCIYCYQIKQPHIETITIPQYIIMPRNNSEYHKEATQKIIENKLNNIIIQFEQYQYIDIYILCSLNIIIISYIFYKKYQ